MQNKITEQTSLYRNLENKSTFEILSDINNEDKKVAQAVSLVIPMIEQLVDAAYAKVQSGGRLFYIGAGTSGRLGILDASECPPTFGIPFDMVIGLIAGGDVAIRKAVENAEDDESQAWNDLKEWQIDENDFVVGIAASGTTPYVIGGLKSCQQNNIITACITCNPNSPLSKFANFPVEVVVGPEYITGSTRMKSGTAQKLVLNMISTALMIRLGRVKDNRMVDMQLTNAKLIARGVKMILENSSLDYDQAQSLLLEKGSVRAVLNALM